MGLSDLSVEEFEKAKDLLKLLGVFGITEEDLRYLPEAIKKVKSMDAQKEYQVPKDYQEKTKEANKKALTAEDLFGMFSKQIEEIYPDEPRTSQNNK